MKKVLAENGKAVTDEMIAEWESALDRDKWPERWRNAGEIIDGKLPAVPDASSSSDCDNLQQKEGVEYD